MLSLGNKVAPFPSDKAITRTDHLPSRMSDLKKLNYAGMADVPLLPVLFPPDSSEYPREEPGQWIYTHICTTPRFKNFSTEELRLKWLVSAANVSGLLELQKLSYAGMADVPAALSPTLWSEYHRESSAEGLGVFTHICTTQTFRDFSTEELRLKLLVSGAADLSGSSSRVNTVTS